MKKALGKSSARFQFVVFLLVGLNVLTVSCGGNSIWGDSSSRFVNKTTLADTQFQPMAEAKWKEAQETIATQIQYDLYGDIVSVPDERTAAAARAVTPQNVVVRGTEEVPASELNDLPNCLQCPYRDPSGLIYCPGQYKESPSGAFKYCNAYMNKFCEIVVPTSRPEYMGPYEMENCILQAIGHDPHNR